MFSSNVDISETSRCDRINYLENEVSLLNIENLQLRQKVKEYQQILESRECNHGKSPCFCNSHFISSNSLYSVTKDLCNAYNGNIEKITHDFSRSLSSTVSNSRGINERSHNSGKVSVATPDHDNDVQKRCKSVSSLELIASMPCSQFDHQNSISSHSIGDSSMLAEEHAIDYSFIQESPCRSRKGSYSTTLQLSVPSTPCKTPQKDKATPQLQELGKRQQSSDRIFSDAELLQLRSLQLRLRNQSKSKPSDIISSKWFDTVKNTYDKATLVRTFLEFVLNFTDKFVCRAIINSTDKFKNTALHYLIAKNEYKAAKVLLEFEGVDCQLPNKAGFSVSEMILNAEIDTSVDFALFKKILTRSNPNSLNNGETLLTMACASEKLDVVRILLESEADINMQTKEGDTALMVAAETGNEELVALILGQPQCNVSLRNKAGESAVAIAVKNGHKQIAMQIYSCNHHKSAPNTPMMRRRPNKLDKVTFV